jgi:uncharacterized membrane protein YhaH (DUF805 family)
MKWYLAALRNYVGFKGRAQRTEFWMFVLVNAIVVTVINLVCRHFFDTLLPGVIYSYAVLVPALAVWARRLHDTGRSGRWLFLLFVPIVGVVILVIFAAMSGTAGANQYGPDPKQEAVAVA